ncbi:MAG TPA: hypothetical protein VK862_00365, partial [Afifellaceae bacterium]|nr:hypothetical protein [Afifellaceae bacterium]
MRAGTIRAASVSATAGCWILALLAATAGTLQAQGRNPHRPIELHDRDGDGKLSPQEWPRKNFRMLDKDADGFLTPEDFSRHWGISLDAAAPQRKALDTVRPAGPRFPKAALGDSGATGRATIPWIDTHVHVSGGSGGRSAARYRETVEQARAAIGEGGFAGAILMPTPQLHPARAGYTTLEGIIDAAQAYPDRFAFLGGGGSLNPMINLESPDGKVSEALRRRFERRAERILALGAVGFGEMTALHFSITDNHPFESVPADHPLFLLLADIAARHDVPIDFHMEPVVRDMETPDYLRARDNPDRLRRNIDGFERLLAHNPKAKIVWVHAGTALLPHRTVALTEELMDRHPNLYLQIGVRPGKVEKLRIMGQNGIN